MSRALSREWLPLAWASLPVALPLLFGGAVVHFNALRVRVERLEQALSTKREALAALVVPAEERAALDARTRQVEEWTQMAASDSLRIAELSRIASSAGVVLRSLRSSGPQTSSDGALVACSHEVTAVGRYRALATFLDGVYAARGMARVDELHLQPDDSTGAGQPGASAGAGRLLATLRVTWCAQAAVAPADDPEDLESDEQEAQE